MYRRNILRLYAEEGNGSQCRDAASWNVQAIIALGRTSEPGSLSFLAAEPPKKKENSSTVMLVAISIDSKMDRLLCSKYSGAHV